MNTATSRAASPLRVLFVDSLAECGGVGTALLNLFEVLDRSCLEPFYASLDVGRGDMPDRIATMGIPVFRLPAGRFRQLWKTAVKIAALRDMIAERRIDVVVANGGHANLFARPAAWWAGRPAAWWVHGWEPTDPLRGHVIAVAHQLVAADALFANSEWTARALRRDFPDRPPIRVVRPGVSLRRFRPDAIQRASARRALGLAESELLTCMVGRLQFWKGQHIYIQAAKILARRDLPCAHLVVGGSPFGLEPEYAAKLRLEVESNGLNGRVRFLGHRDDVPALLNASDVVIHASVEPEPWGLVIAEAMAAGRPVIASAAGGPLEMITHGQTGMLVSPGNASELAEAMQSLLCQPSVRHRLGDAARQFAERSLNPEKAASTFCEEIRKLNAAAVRAP